MIQLLHAMKSAKKHVFYLHSDLVVALKCVFTIMRIIFLVPTASRIISLVGVPTRRLFARLQYTRVARDYSCCLAGSVTGENISRDHDG